MLQIDNTIISLSLLEKRFECDLSACHGCCCRYGDAGAPLKPDEALLLDKLWSRIRPFLRNEGIAAIEDKGTSMTDIEGDLVTPLIGNEECAYTIVEDGIFLCGIERAFTEGAIDFIKPLSCHLFPVRIREYSDFVAVNYEEWQICKPGIETGEKKGTPLYSFLEKPLVRAFGKEWYNKLAFAAKEYKKNNWPWNK